MIQSKYCYPGTTVLRNIPGYKDQRKLETYERIVTGERLLRLSQTPISGRFNLKHLIMIHKFIFADIFPFAGKIREENISKGDFRFAQVPYIESSANVLFEQLKTEKYLARQDVNQFSDRIAYYMAEINVLHPFREGNGRTQREFIRTLALKNGYCIEWNRIEPNEFLRASILSVRDHSQLSSVINNTISNRVPDKHLIKKFEKLLEWDR